MRLESKRMEASDIGMELRSALPILGDSDAGA